MFWRSKHNLTGLALVTMCTGCASLPEVEGAGRTRPAPASSFAAEEQVFRVAITELLDSLPAELYVDPNPVLIENAIKYPDASAYYEKRSDVKVVRLDILNKIGADTVTSFPVRGGCTGRMVPPSFRRTAECPHEDRGELAFDLVQRVQETNQYRIRVIHIFYTPEYRSASIFDMYFGTEREKFIHVKTNVLVFID